MRSIWKGIKPEWETTRVRTALVADTSDDSCGTSLYRDSFPDFETALYAPDFVGALRRQHRRDDISGTGSFEVADDR